MEVSDHYQHQINKYVKTLKYNLFTHDARTLPNNKALMSIRTKLTTNEFKLMDLTMGIPEVIGMYVLSLPFPHFYGSKCFCCFSGAHQGNEFSQIFLENIAKLNLIQKLFSITADNA